MLSAAIVAPVAAAAPQPTAPATPVAGDSVDGTPTADPRSTTAVSDTAAPDTDAPDTAVSDTAAPDTAAPDMDAPDTDADPLRPSTTKQPGVEASQLVGDEAAVWDRVLPCGVRVIIARDVTLPVAAVVLAIETGTEDDPAGQLGLVNALAYQLLQGNRALAPGGATAIVHDSGGLTALAVGPAQVRYESLVPISRLREVVWAESQRLRAPTVSEVLWRDSLRWAKRNKKRKWSAPLPAIAAAHDTPGIAHSGRTVGPEIASMSPRAVSTAIANRFHYSNATLVIVGPRSFEESFALAEAAFSDLPRRTRRLPARVTGPRRSVTGTVARSLAIKGGKGTQFVWPIAPTPAAVLGARAWCKALSRQRRVTGEPKRARVRCTVDADPRRPTVVVVASGTDNSSTLLAGRLDRLADGSDHPLIAAQAQLVLQNDRLALRTPLALARRLAQSDARSKGSEVPLPASVLVGHRSMGAADTPGRVGTEFELAGAIRLTPVAEPAP